MDDPDPIEEPVSPEMSCHDQSQLIFGPVTPWIPNQTEIENEREVGIYFQNALLCDFLTSPWLMSLLVIWAEFLLSYSCYTLFQWKPQT